jgi:hypothetical protein
MAGRRSKGASTAAAAATKPKEEKATPDHGTKDVVAQLNQLANGWGETEEMQGGGDLPDAEYQVKILDATINTAKSSGRLQVSWDLEVASGRMKGRHAFKHDGLDTPENRAWFRGGLARLGVEWPAKPSQLPDKLQELVGSYAEMTFKTRDGQDIQNKYFNKAIDETDLIEGDGPAPTASKSSAKPGKATKSAPVENEGEGEDPTTEEPTETGEDSSEDDGNTSAEVSVELKFEDKDLKPRHLKFIEDQAKKFPKDYKLKDYDNKIDCLADIAESEYSVSGTFDNPDAFIGAIQDAIDAA